MRLMLAAILAACGLAVAPSMIGPAQAVPTDCPPNCDRIPNSAWIDADRHSAVFDLPLARPGRSLRHGEQPALPIRGGLRHAAGPRRSAPVRGRRARRRRAAGRAVAAAGTGIALAWGDLARRPARGGGVRQGSRLPARLSADFSADFALAHHRQPQPDGRRHQRGASRSAGPARIPDCSTRATAPSSRWRCGRRSPPRVEWPPVPDAEVLDALAAPLCRAYIDSCR